MNKTLKNILIIIGSIFGFAILAFIFFLVIGIFLGADEKTFTSHGFTITLTDDFYEKDYASLTAYFESSDVIVTALKEDFTSLEVVGLNASSSVSDYMKAVFETNEFSGDIKKSSNGKYEYTEYKSSSSGKEFSYLMVTLKGKDAFWLVNFACESKNIDEYREKFLKYADTIKVD